jgi:hypothetical protein
MLPDDREQRSEQQQDDHDRDSKDESSAAGGHWCDPTAARPERASAGAEVSGVLVRVRDGGEPFRSTECEEVAVVGAQASARVR